MGVAIKADLHFGIKEYVKNSYIIKVLGDA